MKYFKTRKAFTLLEVIFVIIILGIVASIGSTIVVQLFDNYLTQRAMYRVSLKTELAVEQIVNRLAYRIDSSVIVRDLTVAGLNNFTPLEDFNYGNSQITPQALEWIGYENDSFSSRGVPGWSGYCDTVATVNRIIAGNRTRVVTPGSNLQYANTVIRNLSGNTKRLRDAALLFAVNNEFTKGNFIAQPARCYGYIDNTCIHTVGGRNGQNQIRLDNNLATNTNISPLYKLAWSAYAIVPTNIRHNNSLFDLELHYNYQPWDGMQYDNPNTRISTLIRNVTSFKYSELGGTIRIKLCATEQLGGTVADDVAAQNISVCKEKVVIR